MKTAKLLVSWGGGGDSYLIVYSVLLRIIEFPRLFRYLLFPTSAECLPRLSGLGAGKQLYIQSLGTHTMPSGFPLEKE